MPEDQRNPAAEDLRRLFDRLDGIKDDTNGIKQHLAVYMAENNARVFAMELKTAEHSKALDEFERFKDRGVVFGIIAFLMSGGAGAGVAHLVKKFLE